jgi:hypothetical protein
MRGEINGDYQLLRVAPGFASNCFGHPPKTGTPDDQFGEPRIDLCRLLVMGKFGWTAIVVLGAAFAADRYWNYGYYTESALVVLRQIRQSFGW